VRQQKLDEIVNALPALTINMMRRGFLSTLASASRCGADDLRALASPLMNRQPWIRSVVHGDREAVIVHVQDQVLAHDARPIRPMSALLIVRSFRGCINDLV